MSGFAENAKSAIIAVMQRCSSKAAVPHLPRKQPGRALDEHGKIRADERPADSLARKAG